VITRSEEIDTLQVPNVLESPSLVRVLETIRELKVRVGDTVPIIAVAISPFSLPVMQMGFDSYIELLYEQPVRFERLMQANESFTVEWANAQLAAGATAICYFDPISSPTNIPRELYLKTGQQVAKRTLGRINGPTATHMASGRALPIMADIADTGTAVVGVSVLEDMGELKAGSVCWAISMVSKCGAGHKLRLRLRLNKSSPRPGAEAGCYWGITTEKFHGRCRMRYY
jgi:uroporphyrinogen decarboxylase